MKYAFLVGINKFRGGDIDGSDLRGCENDIAGRGQTRDHLVKGYGFADANIRMLLNERAKKHEIWARLEEYIEMLKAGDELVWWMSCHGTRYPLRDAETGRIGKVADVMCATDFTWDDPVLTGPALKKLFARKRDGVKILCVFDACHSGDAFRDLRPPPSIAALISQTVQAGAEIPQPVLAGTPLSISVPALGGSYSKVESAAPPAVNSIPRYVRPPADILHRFRCLERGIGQNPEKGETPPGLLFFSGCDFDETSADAFIDSDYHGAFTYHFWKAVNEAEGRATFHELIVKVRQMLKAAGYSQNPGLEGDPEEAATVFLGGSVSEEEVPAGPKPPAQKPPKPPGSFADGYDLPEDFV